MKPTIPYLKQKFDEFNTLCFGGKLAPLPIKLSDAKTYMGNVSYRKRRKINGQWEYYDFTMRINTRIDTSEEELEDTLLHEMIHYYLYANHIDDGKPHGPHFRQMMQTLNERYGRHITISHKSTQESRAQMLGTKPTKHIFGIITTKNGERYVKVVPRIQSRVLYFHNEMMRTDKISSIQWYFSNDPYFNQFPSSVSMRVFYFDEEEMTQHLKGAIKIHCDGKSLRIEK